MKFFTAACHYSQKKRHRQVHFCHNITKHILDSAHFNGIYHNAVINKALLKYEFCRGKKFSSYRQMALVQNETMIIESPVDIECKKQ